MSFSLTKFGIWYLIISSEVEIPLKSPYVSCLSYYSLHYCLLQLIFYVICVQLPFSCPEINDLSSTGFAFDRSSGLIALRAENYYVQFFSLFNNLELFQVLKIYFLIWLIFIWTIL